MELGREIAEFARMELRRTLASAKGLALLSLYGLAQVAGGLFFAAAFRSPAGQFLWQALLALMGGAGGKPQLELLASVPPPLLFGYWFTQLALPALVLITGFDQLAGELATRSVRYVAFRSRRLSWALGKALAQAALVALLSAASTAVVLGFSLFTAQAGAAASLGWALRLWLLTCVGSFAYVGLVTLVSACFRTPFLALATGAAALFGLWVLGGMSHFGNLQWLAYLLPGTYVDQLLTPVPSSALAAAVVCVLYGDVLLAAAVGVLRARDL